MSNGDGQAIKEYEFLNDEDMKAFEANEHADMCGGCRFWREIEPPTYPDQKWTDYQIKINGRVSLPHWKGFCKRNPPFIDNDDEDSDGYNTAIWPVTDWREWCGEWKGVSHTFR
jgi:hypothetical protein